MYKYANLILIRLVVVLMVVPVGLVVEMIVGWYITDINVEKSNIQNEVSIVRHT